MKTKQMIFAAALALLFAGISAYAAAPVAQDGNISPSIDIGNTGTVASADWWIDMWATSWNASNPIGWLWTNIWQSIFSNSGIYRQVPRNGFPRLCGGDDGFDSKRHE